MTARLCCIGYGYTARVFAGQARARGWRVAATARDDEKRFRLHASGLEAMLFPPDPLETFLGQGAHLLISSPPGENGDPLLAAAGETLAALSDRLGWIGYLSTTAVYGDWGGAWVDEASPLRAAAGRGEARVRAEAQWLEFGAKTGAPVHIFRLAGIYGPGRGPFEKVRAGTARRIIKPGQVFGRIHVEDIAQTLWASVAAPNPGAIYNVTDDLTCPPAEVISHAAALLGLPEPEAVPFESAQMTPMARSFYADNKRVSNARIKTELGVDLLYPTYREGLAAVAQAEGLS